MIRLPWLGVKPSKYLEKKTRDAVRNAYYAARVISVYTTSCAFKLREDHLPIPMMSSVMYNFECRQCGSRYVGRMIQHLQAKIKRHVPRYLMSTQTTASLKSRTKGKLTSDDQQSAIAKHLCDNERCRQVYKNSDFTVPSLARSEYHLRILEAVYIKRDSPVLCRQKQFVTDLQLFTS